MAEENVMVPMVHKDFPDRTPALVTPDAFKKVWEDKGWKLWKEPSSPTSSPSSLKSEK